VKKVFVQTFGCQMNEADSEEMLSALMARGYMPAASLREADAVLINTCTVRDHAEHRALSYIGRLAKWKSNCKTRNRIVIVAGCAAQRLGRKLTQQFPHVDIVAGAKLISSFPELLDNAGLKRDGDAPGATAPLCAYVTIMRGCNCDCAYCIVPSVRGPAVFRDPQEIYDEAAAKTAAGAKEIILLGQTVNSYRHPDCKDFAALLALLHGIPGLARLRFMSPHPLFVTPGLVEAYASLPKLAHHIHLPVQSGSDRILTLMKRGYTRAKFLQIAQALRRVVPAIAISTDFIVGFPTETGADFEQSLSLVDEAGISAAYCFKYSPRQGTQSCAMEGELSRQEMEGRLGRLLERTRASARRQMEAFAGRTVEVLMENQRSGRTSENFWVGLQGAAPGDFIKAKVTAIKDRTLEAVIAPEVN
jgi:tRNA-2-methylthio-N6-dimethylallyladenosine synthase